MKRITTLLSIILTMATSQTSAQMGKATTIKKTFSRRTYVSIDINADKSIIWKLLTTSEDFPRWNSTVNWIKGNIALGEKLEIKVPLDEKRTFKVKVKEFEPESRMVWGDGMGNRQFILSPNDQGGITFTMDEKMGGPLFPLFAGMIPPFDDAFESYVADLKKEAESIQATQN